MKIVTSTDDDTESTFENLNIDYVTVSVSKLHEYSIQPSC